MNELERRYRARVLELREQVLQAIRRLYGQTIDPDDLDAAFEAFIPRAAVILRAGQARGISLATGYLSALVTVMGGRTADLRAFTGLELVGFTADGRSLAAGMDAFPAMVKARIAEGLDIADAIDHGRFAAERFTDGELTAAIDKHTDAVTSASGEFSGWEGIVSGNACDPCAANAGFHELSEPIYRHGNCNCTKQYVVAI